MADASALSPEMRQFIEAVGLYFEQYGVSRIGGRLIALLLIATEPLTLDDMAAALDVSRASVSTNIRIVVTYGLAQLVTKPGDRRDYYHFAEHGWERGIVVNAEATRLLRRLAERGLSATAPEDMTARARLEEMADFCDFSLEEMEGMLARWRRRQQG